MHSTLFRRIRGSGLALVAAGFALVTLDAHGVGKIVIRL
jgi:hypothetical protein